MQSNSPVAMAGRLLVTGPGGEFSCPANVFQDLLSVLRDTLWLQIHGGVR
jgi:hypothetical protein